MKRKSLFLSTALVICALLLNMFAGITVFAADGDTATVIEIDSADDLLAVANDLTASYKLTKDIDLKDGEGNKTAWTPLGTFSGTFDGNGHTISGFTVSGTASGETGFFKVVSGTVKNLTIANASVTTSAANMTGVIVGKLDATGTISGCTLDSDVTLTVNGKFGSNVYAGGFVGQTYGTVEYCENNGTVTVQSSLNASGSTRETLIGGIAGRAVGNVQYCVNNGDVTIADYSNKKGGWWTSVGGIVGIINPWSGATSNVEGCINNGAVSNLCESTKSTSASGIVGFTDNNGTRNINNCFNLGTVTCGNPNGIGQILGHKGKAITYSGNYGIEGLGSPCVDETGCATLTSLIEIVRLDAYKTLTSTLATKGMSVVRTATDFVAYQTSASARDKSATDNTQVFDLRLIAVIGGDISDCTAVGFDVEATYDGLDAPKTTVQSMVTVYDSVTGVADGEPEEYTAADLGGDYIFVLSVRGIPTTATSITFTVTTYYTDSTGTVYSAAETFTVDASSIPTVDMPEIAA